MLLAPEGQLQGCAATPSWMSSWAPALTGTLRIAMLPLRMALGRGPAHLVAGMDILTVLQEADDAQKGRPLDRQVKGCPA